VERHFEKALADLNMKIVEMGAKAVQMIEIAVQALAERRPELTAAIDPLEHEVDHMQIEIDDIALRLIATHQPVATDLRFLVTAMKINNELERIGDKAVNISENTHILLQQPPVKPLIDLPLMADLAKTMVRDSLDAFVKRDPIQAEAVIMRDDKVDALKDKVFADLLTFMIADPSTIQRALALILISRNLERIGDQAVNIAEDVIYMAAGRDVRHPGDRRNA
jgi:phosphate transport system protein